MNRLEKIKSIRKALSNGNISIGSWMQLSDPSVAEIMGQGGYDWIAIDLEHGSITISQLPDLFRALELGGTLPLARLAQGGVKDCKQVLDAGAGGVIVPMVESSGQLQMVIDACKWPPAGTRGVGFSRANLFGKHFEEYRIEAQAPLIVAMIEHVKAVNELEEILKVDGLDAILVGPYDLSASMNKTGEFDDPEFKEAISTIKALCEKHKIACGLHVVQPDEAMLQQRINEKYRFIAYSIDTVFFNQAVKNPLA